MPIMLSKVPWDASVEIQENMAGRSLGEIPVATDIIAATEDRLKHQSNFRRIKF